MRSFDQELIAAYKADHVGLRCLKQPPGAGLWYAWTEGEHMPANDPDYMPVATLAPIDVHTLHLT